MPNAMLEGSTITNLRLAEAFLERGRERLDALAALRQEADFSDIIREARDIVSLCFRGMLRAAGVEVARWRDPGEVLVESVTRLPGDVRSHRERLTEIYRDLSRERYESLPEEGGHLAEKVLMADADRAISEATWVVTLTQQTIDRAANRKVPASPASLFR